MWTIENIGRDERGVILPGFAVLLPILILMTFGTIETSSIIFDWHRASEATRRAARTAAISEPIADVSTFARGASITCKGSSAGAVSCVGSSVVNADVFSALMTEMQDIQPAIQPENVSVTYSDSGLGDPAIPGGILPLVTVRIDDLQRDLYVLGGFLGMPETFTYPSLLTNQIGNGIGQTE